MLVYFVCLYISEHIRYSLFFPEKKKERSRRVNPDASAALSIILSRSKNAIIVGCQVMPLLLLHWFSVPLFYTVINNLQCFRYKSSLQFKPISFSLYMTSNMSIFTVYTIYCYKTCLCKIRIYYVHILIHFSCLTFCRSGRNLCCGTRNPKETIKK